MNSSASTQPSVQPLATQRRRNNFDFLRLFFAILVIFSHSFILGGAGNKEPFAWLTNGQSDGGRISVDCFFILSGYLITASFLRSANIRDYVMKRIRRIYPGFLVAYSLSACVVPAIVHVPLPVRFTLKGVLHFLFTALQLHELNIVGAFPQNLYPDWVNGSLWTIRYEFACYILVAILGLTGLLYRRTVTAWLFVATVVLRATFPLWSHEIPSGLGIVNWVRFVPMYLAGVVAWLYRDRIRFSRPWIVVSIVAIVGAAILPFSWQAVFAFAGTYLLLSFAGAASIPLHNAAKYGDFSYGIYLYAYPVQQILIWSNKGRMSPLPLFAGATLLTLLFAVASWYLIEKPFMRGKN